MLKRRGASLDSHTFSDFFVDDKHEQKEHNRMADTWANKLTEGREETKSIGGHSFGSARLEGGECGAVICTGLQSAELPCRRSHVQRSRHRAKNQICNQNDGFLFFVDSLNDDDINVR